MGTELRSGLTDPYHGVEEVFLERGVGDKLVFVAQAKESLEFGHAFEDE